MLLFLLILGCQEAPKPAPAVVTEAVPPAEAEGPRWPDPAAPSDARYAASHILLAWKGAPRAPKTVTRTEEEAETLAVELFTALEGGTDFATLAADNSDAPSAARGGRVGTYLVGTMMPEFEASVAGAEIGAYTLAHTAFGWHVIRRDAVEHIAIAHIVLGFEGAHESTATRSLEEAQAAMAQIEARLAAGEAFGDLAGELNEDPSKATDGELGGFGRGQMVPAFEDAAFALQVGETSAVIQTPYGLHILRRTD